MQKGNDAHGYIEMADFEESLKCCTNDSVNLFSLRGKTLLAKAVDVYDGDTATFCVYLSGELCKFKMRLSGIDTPEMRPSRSSPHRDDEKKAAKYVRNRLLQLVTDQDVELEKNYSKREIATMLSENRKLVHLSCGKAGKFGRTLVHVFLDEANNLIIN